MNKSFLKTATLFLIFTSISCKDKIGNASKYEKLGTMDWLLGNWENKLPEGDLSESWEKKDDSTFVGHSYFIKEKYTISFESIELLQKGEELFYIPTVKGQNNDKPVSFKLITATAMEFTFENSSHDYPQKIVYKKAGPNDLIVAFSGTQQGKASTESYPMKRK